MDTTEPPTAPVRARTVTLRRGILGLTLALGALLFTALGFGAARLTAGSPHRPVPSSLPPGYLPAAYAEGYNWADLETSNLANPMPVPAVDEVKGTCQQAEPQDQKATYVVSWLLGCEDFLSHRPANPSVGS
ncbi:hypothetical protein [Streptacidiphilus jiangxiensis]|uniref:Uncharacterized protein n=1 Tax=Streptacidiphilus jiangxiensis TaxID=235985 RepID=A0A1H8APK0_STRJI|nr:hypothetical protein [Streptacidiphilus jiangxiensis]SEM71894.1 hypothetical protein SAMN05414137_14723 [Streptacidiphilus jiangxiensis]